MQPSIWEKETYFKQHHFIIIGSGFVGLWNAFFLKLKFPQHSVLVLERGLIPSGASTRNAGFSCFGSPGELLKDAQLMGESSMWDLVQQRYEGLSEIQYFFEPDEIGYEGSGGFECFQQDNPQWEACKEKLDWLNEGMYKITNQEHVFRMVDNKLPLLGLKGFDHLIENKLEGSLHSGKLLLALLKKVQGMGVLVLNHIEVDDFALQNDRVELNTNAGTFHAERLIVSTNAFAKKLVPELDIVPNRGQILVTAPIPGFKLKGCFHFDEGFYYFRNIQDRLLLGGARNTAFEEESTLDMEVTDTVQSALESFANKHLDLSAPLHITDRWSGIMAMGSEKKPIVKTIHPQVYCCVRMSGMGVALAPVVARQISNLIH